jgi:2-hydroxycyclohexanecarboxyl-CoA dehydrogenase
MGWGIAVPARTRAPQGALTAGALRKAVPWGRLRRLGDVAGAVVFLASDEAEFVTGQTVSVSGGLTMI